MSPARREAIAWALGCLSLLQMAGSLMGWQGLERLASTWGMAPRPKVFCAVDGHEPFSSRFYLGYTAADGTSHEEALAQDLYQRMRGPYNRRNVYGAAMAYGPVLEASVRQPVFCFGLRQGAAFRQDLGLPEGAHDLYVRVEGRIRDRPSDWKVKAPCP